MAFWFWAAVAAAVVAAGTAALLSQVRVRVRYSRNGKLDHLVIIVRALFGIVRMQTIVPSIMMRGWSVVYRQKNRSEAGILSRQDEGRFRLTWSRMRRYRRVYRDLQLSTKGFRRWLRRTLRKVECTRWRLDVSVGTGDAASTGAAAGFFWSVLGCAVAATDSLTTLKTRPHGEVRPVFSGKEFSVVWEADFRIRLGTVFFAGIRLGTRTVKLARALRAWRSWMTKPERA
jgi:hypothetical protein